MNTSFKLTGSILYILYVFSFSSCFLLTAVLEGLGTPDVDLIYDYDYEGSNLEISGTLVNNDTVEFYRIDLKCKIEFQDGTQETEYVTVYDRFEIGKCLRFEEDIQVEKAVNNVSCRVSSGGH